MSSLALAMVLLATDPATTTPAAAQAAPVAPTDVAATPLIALHTEAPPAVAILPEPAPEAAELTVPGKEEEIVVTGRRRDPGDPFQNLNAQSFAITQAVDTAIIRPVAKTYQKVLPAPVRDGIRNFLINLREPIVALNFLLQHKVGKAAETIARFTVNSTVGVGGAFDIARRKPFKLPRRPNGFADTLGFYGVKTGVFMFLPIVGPTTVRDLIGSTIDRFILPFAIGKPFNNPRFTLPAGVFGTIDHRAQFDETYEALHKNTPDAYVASREFYLARRQAEIDELRGKGHRVVRPTPDSVRPSISVEPR